MVLSSSPLLRRLERDRAPELRRLDKELARRMPSAAPACPLSSLRADALVVLAVLPTVLAAAAVTAGDGLMTPLELLSFILKSIALGSKSAGASLLAADACVGGFGAGGFAVPRAGAFLLYLDMKSVLFRRLEFLAIICLVNLSEALCSGSADARFRARAAPESALMAAPSLFIAGRGDGRVAAPTRGNVARERSAEYVRCTSRVVEGGPARTHGELSSFPHCGSSASMAQLALVCLVTLISATPCTAFRTPTGTSWTSTYAGIATSSPQPPVVMAARSKAAQENMKKWGKILSQADTFDESIKSKRSSAAPGSGADKNAGGAVVAVISLAAVGAMLLASVQ